MKDLLREGIEDIIPYPPGKPIEELQRELNLTGIIKLASNENPLGPSPMAVKAIRENLVKLNRYPDDNCYYLKQKMAGKFRIPEGNIILGSGSNELLRLIAHSFLSPGQEAIIPFPTFLVYEKIVQAFGGKIINTPLENLRVDLSAVIDSISENTKLIFINNPNNPTGKALKTEEISRFLESVPRNIIVVLDEAYIEFATDPAVESGTRLLESCPLLIVLRTFSKLYGLAGLRIGYGFASEKIIDALNRVRQPFNINYPAQVAASAALEDSGFIERTLSVIKEGLEFFYTNLDRMGIEYVATQTNFLLVKVPLGAEKTYNAMLKKGVIVRSMKAFGLNDYIRVNGGLPEENKRFIEVLEGL